ncbi:MAG: YicC/YloC family endoribonuclease [Verrucomicrobiota bacterium]
MKSMTGYGRGSASTDDLEITVEISSVNRRNLEVSTSSPKEWIGVDQQITERIRAAVSRGKVYVALKATPFGGAEGMNWDDEMVKGTLSKFEGLSKTADIPFAPDSTFLLELVKAIKPASALPEFDAVQSVVIEAFETALAAFLKMRSDEGMVLKADVSSRVECLDALLKQIEANSEGVVDAYRERLFQRLRQSGLEDLDLSDERVLKEIALFADRCDVAEEITRLGSHFEQMRECVGAVDPVGRKMDFIVQEINREFNTIGSKASKLEMTQGVIEAKNELERLREQIANIE